MGREGRKGLNILHILLTANDIVKKKIMLCNDACVFVCGGCLNLQKFQFTIVLSIKIANPSEEMDKHTNSN